jgi:HrpA-like RNA helicase
LHGWGDSANIVCTQPRRIAATSVAERVAEEMCSKIGKQVGYQIRMESKKSAETRLLFCTTGVLLRRLQDDRDLKSLSHIIVDECHERQVEVDVLLIALRNILQTSRRDLKVILMSASIDPALFSNFFGGAPVVTVPGRTFPVSTYFLEDLLDATGHMIEEGSQYAIRNSQFGRNKTTLWVTNRGGEKRRETVDVDVTSDSDNLPLTYSDYTLSTRISLERVDETIINYDLIEDLLEHLFIHPVDSRVLVSPDGGREVDGAVLIFLPGIGEIKSLSSRLASNRNFSNSSKFDILPLHSKLSSAEQRKAFLPSKPGCRKIIISTNVAEASLTIPGTGYERKI